MITIIVLVLILGVLIFVHELGHFVVAKKSGAKVEEFGFGFPPRLFGLYRNKDGKWKKIAGNKEIKDEPNTIYSINWLPLGGFCKIKGEDGSSAKESDSFGSKPIWKRVLILSAGVIMNILLAMVLFSVCFMIGLPQAVDSISGDVRNEKIQIAYVSKESPAENSGLSLGDEIVMINGQSYGEVSEMQDAIKEYAGDEINVQVMRGGEEVNMDVTPRENPPGEEGALGIGLVKTGIVSYPWYTAIWKGILATFTVTIAIIVGFYEIIKNLIMGQPVTADIAGPVGIAVLTGQMARMGLVYVLQFAAILSINLAIINILPFPALDGGRILFLIIEKIKGKPVDQRIENLIHTVGFAMLIILLLFVTFKDVLRFQDVFVGIWDRIAGF